MNTKTKKVNASNKVNASTKENAKKEVTKINLSQFADKLKNVELKVKAKKSTIYKYPDTFSENDINSEKGKKFRNSLRTKLKRFSNNIFVFAKINEVEKLNNEVKEFDIFYKENYQINDYSATSISQSKNEVKEQDIVLMLQIIKEVKK